QAPSASPMRLPSVRGTGPLLRRPPGSVRSTSRSVAAQPRSDRRATTRPSSARCSVGILPRGVLPDSSTTPSRARPCGHCARGWIGTPTRSSREETRSAAAPAPWSGPDPVVVELPGEEDQAAVGGRAGLQTLVGEHRLLLLAAGASHVLVALGVVLPGTSGRDPPTLHVLDRAIDREHLQQ